MIGSIHGSVIDQGDNWTILETASGVGYRIVIGSQVFLPGTQLRLYTHHHVREDASDLYGFQSLEDLRVFELLITVSGVGPKIGQTIVTTLGREAIADAVGNNQPVIFKSVSGVGQKMAEKIIVELRNKLTATPGSGTGGSSELFDALMSLGYKQQEILETLKEIDGTAPTSEQLKQALRRLGK